MKLSEYFSANAITDADFAKAIGRDKSTVFRWRTGRSRPDWSALETIAEVTRGAVTANDFYGYYGCAIGDLKTSGEAAG